MWINTKTTYWMKQHCFLMLAECTHIFEEGTDERFMSRFDIFHDICVAKMVCFGKATKGMTLEEIPMSKVLTTTEYIANVVGAFMNIKPCFLCRGPGVDLIMVETPTKYGTQMYCLQLVEEWPGLSSDQYCCQIWECEPGVTMDHINRLWNEE